MNRQHHIPAKLLQQSFVEGFIPPDCEIVERVDGSLMGVRPHNIFAVKVASAGFFLHRR